MSTIALIGVIYLAVTAYLASLALAIEINSQVGPFKKRYVALLALFLLLLGIPIYLALGVSDRFWAGGLRKSRQ